MSQTPKKLLLIHYLLEDNEVITVLCVCYVQSMNMAIDLLHVIEKCHLAPLGDVEQVYLTHFIPCLNTKSLLIIMVLLFEIRF